MKKIISFIKDIYFINTRHSKNNYFSIQIPKKHYIFLLILFLFILSFNLYQKYEFFKSLKNGTNFEVTIINHYPKPSKNKRVISEIFKLQDSSGNTFYATYRGRFKNLVGNRAMVYGKIYNCSFIRFLSSCNIYNSSLSLLPKQELRQTFVKFIESQHDNNLAANLYNALFFANNLAKPLRDSANALGLSHLLAISGFHLASLSLFFYCLVAPIYFILHRYFCYRNAIYDLVFLGLIFMFFYLILINFQPSFLRAFLMACVGFFMLYSGIKILSFLNLFLCAMLAISFNPSLVFNIGFLLSISGVFYIFLFIKYIGIYWNSKYKKIFFQFLLFDCIIFLQMMPISHIFFPYFSPFQLVCIPMSLIFPLLFPLLLIAHIFRFGSIFDSIIELVLNYDFFISNIYTPLWLVLIYVILSLFAIRYRLCYFLTLLISIIFYFVNLFYWIA